MCPFGNSVLVPPACLHPDRVATALRVKPSVQRGEDLGSHQRDLGQEKGPGHACSCWGRPQSWAAAQRMNRSWLDTRGAQTTTTGCGRHESLRIWIGLLPSTAKCFRSIDPGTVSPPKGSRWCYPPPPWQEPSPVCEDIAAEGTAARFVLQTGARKISGVCAKGIGRISQQAAPE